VKDADETHHAIMNDPSEGGSMRSYEGSRITGITNARGGGVATPRLETKAAEIERGQESEGDHGREPGSDRASNRGWMGAGDLTQGSRECVGAI